MIAAARMGRPPALTRQAIAQAVIEVGFADLTVAAVRDSLGVGQTTLYRYAADRDELIRIGLSHILENAAWPSREGQWRKVISDHALTLWHLWADHPGSATEAARGIIPLSMMRLTDDLCAVLLRQGFTPANAILACDIVFDMVTDNRRGNERFDASNPTAGAHHVQEHGGRYPNQVKVNAGSPATDTERHLIHSAMNDVFAADPLKWFRRKLQVVLDGIEGSLSPEEQVTG